MIQILPTRPRQPLSALPRADSHDSLFADARKPVAEVCEVPSEEEAGTEHPGLASSSSGGMTKNAAGPRVLGESSCYDASATARRRSGSMAEIMFPPLRRLTPKPPHVTGMWGGRSLSRSGTDHHILLGAAAARHHKLQHPKRVSSSPRYYHV